MVCSYRKYQLKEVDSGIGPTHREQLRTERCSNIHTIQRRGHSKTSWTTSIESFRLFGS
uniref:Uncharacterized protein n=1 Tax=Knipowitschia caucasica TaxID=637954 RepID=A0AAV2KKH1_KNICA